MVEEADALAQILEAAHPLPSIKRPLHEALGRFLSEPIRSVMAHPRFDNSVVDGYAVRAEDGMAERRIIGEQAAGVDRLFQLQAGEAVRIFTGAPIPRGCNAVVMQEEIVRRDNQLILREAVAKGENIRRSGADLAAGQILGNVGSPVSPQLIALLASQGLAEVLVHSTPRVTIISTGDELRQPGETLSPGEIYEANAPMLAALLQSIGITAEIRHVRDNLGQIQSEIAGALTDQDVLILNGGVSVGDHDHVRPALDALGIPLDLWRIRMRPGKPLAFAHTNRSLIFGLPGNPVSAFVTFLVLVRPALMQMLGAQGPQRFLPVRNIRISEPLENPTDRPHYLRGKIVGDTFLPAGLQESHALFHLASSQALLRLDSGERLSPGDHRNVLIW